MATEPPLTQGFRSSGCLPLRQVDGRLFWLTLPHPPQSSESRPDRHDAASSATGIRAVFAERRERRSLKSASRGSDVFISYSHSANQELAPALQRGLARMGKRWNRPYALRVFRDQTDLTASPDLWSDIEKALAGSKYFLLLASPAAANSRWVRQEIAYWQQHKSRDRLLIALVDGEIEWSPDMQDFVWEHTDALPATLSGYFERREPLWVDIRSQRYAQASLTDPQFADAVATLAAPVHGIGKDEMISEDVRAHRTFNRIRAGAVAVLAMLLVLAVSAASVAIVQRNEARNQARVALSRQLAATAENLLSTNLRAALQLAASAYRTDANPQTTATLIRANLATPKLVRYLSADATVSLLACSADGKTVVAGLSDGSIIRWRAPRWDSAVVVGTLGKRIVSVAVNGDGSVIAAADGSESLLWRADQAAVRLTAPAGQGVDIVGISPSGHTIVVHGGGPSASTAQSVSVLELSPMTTVLHDDPLHTSNTRRTSAVTVVSDDEVLLFDGGGGGGWDRRRTGDWSQIGSGDLGLGIRQEPGRPSADGRFLTATNGDPTIPVWSTDALGVPGGSSDPRLSSGFTAEAPNKDSPGPIALSPDGSSLAIVTAESLYVAPIAARGAARGPTIEIAGIGTPNGIMFRGDNTHLLSVSNRHIALWDLGQIDRLAQSAPISLPDTCRGCGDPDLSISPGGLRAAVIDERGNRWSRLILQPIPGTDGATQIVEKSDGVVVWPSDDYAVLISSSRSGVASTGMLKVMSNPGSGDVATAALTTDRRAATVVNTKGAVYRVDLETGKWRSGYLAPLTLAAEGRHLDSGTVAIDSTARYVAMLIRGYDGQRERIEIVDVTSGSVVGTVVYDDIVSLTYAGQWLLVGRRDRPLEIWDSRGTRMRQTIADVSAAVGNHAGTVAAESHRSKVTLVDLGSGTSLGTLSVPDLEVLAYQRTAVAFSADDSRVVTVTNGGSQTKDGVIIERNLSPMSLLDNACSTAGRPLSDEEFRSITGLDQSPLTPCAR